MIKPPRAQHVFDEWNVIARDKSRTLSKLEPTKRYQGARGLPDINAHPPPAARAIALVAGYGPAGAILAKVERRLAEARGIAPP